MQYTSNSKLALYESYDQFNITGDTDSLNNNMKIIDNSINTLNNNVIELNNALNEKAEKDVATQSANGLMSSADKTKLDGIEEGANKTVVDTALSDTSTNPVQNKVIDAALAGKANTSHTHTKSEITDFPTSLPASDVSEWAKAATKPTYTASEVGADASGSANTALTAAKVYTDTEIAGLINGAPTTLDTLGEIATAMSENQSVVEALNSAIGTKANASDLTTHTGNTSNPHSVTKAQVGLGNVPNVSTNDQTPTYSDTTTFETLTSGEKISVALGKIKLAITNLINHIANKSNPHGVTKSQIGLGNVGNFKAVSTVAGQGLTEDEKANARTNIGVGTSSFSGDYNDLSNKPVVDTALSSTSTNTVQNKVVNSALNNKADKSKYGDTTINVGRKSGTTVGSHSTAEGTNTTASGVCSHSEGNESIASGYYSHSGGAKSNSKGLSSFAHGTAVNANNDYEVAFGKYNNSHSGLLFSIGDGEDSDNIHNAFEVTSVGARVHDQVIVTTKSGFNDIRIEHGSMTFTRITSAKSYTVEFSNSFATLLGVVVSVRDTTCTASSYAIVTDESKTGFTVKASYSNGFEWIAIGTDTIVNSSIGGGEPVG